MKRFSKIIIAAAMLNFMAANLYAQEFTFLSSSSGSGRAKASGSSSKVYYDDTFSDLLTEIIVIGWVLNNFIVTFEPYPYAEQGKYLVYGDWDASSNFSSAYVSADGSGDTSDENSGVKSRVFRFAADAGMFCMQGFPAGSEVRFEGFLYKFFGPVFENVLYAKVPAKIGTYPNDAGNLRLGAELALVQTNMITLTTFFQWDHWYGSVKADGVAFGLIARSYPVKPLLLEWRGIWHVVENSEMFESILEAGIMVWKNIEVFASWRYLKADGWPIYFDDTAHNGITAGARIHF